ncbi:carbon-nitrogen hydrolase family protein [Yinghuangia seranimata]|uniref:carbon-nitrogen hydrolase family protein n=1 Tax=Yinghuangia seranimata TaxID=408067 RepID=UPI00248C05AD|nr:carbon-nitrogen hydrolase family protein [Yinghuangia seranimata]MDI2126522.1 carbon-nitrogen hydrolase family protein [Yinghuangia seranimata]
MITALPTRTLRVASAQTASVPGDIAANTATVARLVHKAADAGAALVVLPEKILTGYEPGLIASDPDTYAVTETDPRLDPIAEACRATGTAAVVGAVVADTGRLYVSALVVDGAGKVVGRADKQHLFATEVKYYVPGRSACTFTLDGWRLGLGICYDSGFPEHARAAALDGCHAYLVGGLFSCGGGEVQVRGWFPARAIDNTMYALLSNHVGPAGPWLAAGGSAVWGPDGRLVAQGPGEGEAVVCADLDPNELARVRAELTMLADLPNGPGDNRRRYLG